MSRRWVVAMALVGCAALGAVACGGGTDTGSGSSSAGSSTTVASNDTVQARDSALGNVLTNADGRTLYLFMKDSGGKSNCSGACAQLWPALTVAAGATPTGGPKIDAAKLATITRDDGSLQVTYAGNPLYLYTKDAQPGDVNGQNVGGVWFAVGVDGAAVKGTAAAATTTTAKGSSY